jgi:hypothetical protein
VKIEKPLALPHPGSNRGGKRRKLSYSYVNESRGQVRGMEYISPTASVVAVSAEKGHASRSEFINNFIDRAAPR